MAERQGAEDAAAYSIRPNFKQKFRPAVVNKIIHQVLVDRLTGAQYSAETCAQWTKEIADDVKNRLKELDYPRYKYVVNVMIGEMRGEGIRMGCRCFWDADTDNVAEDTFINVSIGEIATRSKSACAPQLNTFLRLLSCRIHYSAW
ncbi:Tctex-1 family-domain-containing protein [Fimicolochytrium jonesii]|uniref:Tctex-1 family-domain-containing protein n=1 Tax=Fimicolochytrium jonesii TaxID=1396493 RepID=UPI0022FE0C0C|nr:Tctex-1 family-domain-containing protein [Fimicolochytrium jonesii]KAI8823658.1 Tctex-1 family-domain-containing protein [Fimicolochytrium jonesii]